MRLFILVNKHVTSGKLVINKKSLLIKILLLHLNHKSHQNIKLVKGKNDKGVSNYNDNEAKK